MKNLYLVLNAFVEKCTLDLFLDIKTLEDNQVCINDEIFSGYV